MVNLDDKNAILKLQGGDAVLKSIDALPQQLQQSFTESLQVKFPDKYRNVKNIVVCGMGGSRFTPLIVKELFKEEISLPYLINDDYNLPGFVDENTLVILSSFSGTTEEVIRCGKKAQTKGALLAGLAAGDGVIDFLKSANAPFYVFDPKYNPSGQPRIGSGYMIGGHLGLLLNLGILKIEKLLINKTIEELPSLLRNFTIDTKTEENPAKKLALQLQQRYPYYVVSEFLTGVGNAIANQTNETAKSISSFRIIPELNHHLMEGLKFPQKHGELAVFVLFFSRFYSESVQKRFQITKEVIEQNKIKTVWIELNGENKIEQTFYLMGLGSYMTMYLSALYEQDPAVIPYVDYFKKKLKEMG